MKPGRYAAADGSFARSAGGAGARGLALLALALLIGVVLLNATDADPPGTTVSADGDADSPSGDGGDSDAAGEGTSPAPTTTVPPTTLPARAAKDVKVIVANASAVKGAAGNAKKVLDPAGYNNLAPANAAPVETTSVFFVPGYDRDAAAVAVVLQLPPTVVKPMPAPLPFDTKGAQVAIVLGADQAAKFAAAPGATPAPTTTVAGGAAPSTTVAGAAATTTTKKP